MLKSMMGILVLILLHGCTTKEEKHLFHTYDASRIYHKQLQKTQQLQLKRDGITTAMLTATYLVDKKHHRSDERFVVGIYIEEGMEQNFINEGYTLGLDEGNGKLAKPTGITSLDKSSPYLKNLSFVTSWNHFYLVSFPHTNKTSFNLVFTSPDDGSGTLYFAKVAKYTLKK